MHQVADVLPKVERFLQRTWPEDLLGQSLSWPKAFPLGASNIEKDWAETWPTAQQWFTWARNHPDVQLRTATRRVHGTSQVIPTHLEVPSLQVACSLAGPDIAALVGTARERLPALRSQCDPSAALLRSVAKCSPVDFRILQHAALWCRNHPTAGLTAREVPIPGVHAKWIQKHQSDLETVMGQPLQLSAPRPHRLTFRYVDPNHEGRQHDTYVIGDCMPLPYAPEVALIVENRDTAWAPSLQFPKGIIFDGGGHAAVHIAEAASTTPWLHSIPTWIYWGDMDTAGLEIVSNLRRRGLPIQTFFMDLPAYEKYATWGTTLDQHGRPLCPTSHSPTHLTPGEAELYNHLLTTDGPKRIEQERIPLPDALHALSKITSANGAFNST